MTLLMAYGMHFMPDYLFVAGDPSVLIHPPGFGELLHAQAFLLLLAIVPTADPRRRQWLPMLAAWAAIGAVPAALTLPLPHSQHDVINFAPLTLIELVRKSLS